MSDGDDEAGPAPLPERDFDRYHGYWHGFTFFIFDSHNDEAWIRSTQWVPIDGEGDGD